MNSGKYVFSQSVEFLPRYEFDKLVKKFNGNFHTRNLSCYNQFLHLLFGQLTACDSLRDICLCLKAHQRVLYHLGFRQTVDESSLSRANERRDYRIYEELGYILIDIVRPMYAEERIPELYCQDYDVFALDSTTISCSIKLLSWALGKYTKGAVKMHTVIDLRGTSPYSSISQMEDIMTAIFLISLILFLMRYTQWIRPMLISKLCSVSISVIRSLLPEQRIPCDMRL